MVGVVSGGAHTSMNRPLRDSNSPEVSPRLEFIDARQLDEITSDEVLEEAFAWLSERRENPTQRMICQIE